MSMSMPDEKAKTIMVGPLRRDQVAALRAHRELVAVEREQSAALDRRAAVRWANLVLGAAEGMGVTLPDGSAARDVVLDGGTFYEITVTEEGK